MQDRNIFFSPVLHRNGGVGQGGKRCFSIEEEGPVRSLQIRVPAPAKKKDVGIRTKHEIHMVHAMPQYPQILITESLFVSRMVVPVQLVHVGVKRDFLKTCIIVHQLPGIDVSAGIDHLPESSR